MTEHSQSYPECAEALVHQWRKEAVRFRAMQAECDMDEEYFLSQTEAERLEKCALELELSVGATADKPALGVLGSLPSGESDPLVTTDSTGAGSVAQAAGDCGEWMPLALVPLENPNHDPGEHQVMDGSTAYIFKIVGGRDLAERVVAALNAGASALSSTESK